MEGYSPYRPPPEHRSVGDEYHYPNAVQVSFTDARESVDREVVEQAYDDAVEYLTARYHRIFETLRERYDLVITCGDHGEAFGIDATDGL